MEGWNPPSASVARMILRPGRLRQAALLLAACALSGCASLGPNRLGIDRSQYSEKLRESGKEELLLNIVALRHGDPPLFLQVSSVISQYTREGSVGANLAIKPSAGADNRGGVSGEVLLRETPTITYTPLSGERFAQSMLAPLSPASLLGMIESGWAPDQLFRLSARSINGVRNKSSSPYFPSLADPQFEELMGALGRLHASGSLVFHVRHHQGGGFELTAQRSEALSDADKADLELTRRILKLEADSREPFAITFGALPGGPRQLSIATRSMFEIFAEAAQGVDGGAAAPMIHIRSGGSPPGDAHVAARYRGIWYWIDGGDTQSIRNFLIVQILLSLMDSGSGPNAPLVTIPAG